MFEVISFSLKKLVNLRRESSEIHRPAYRCKDGVSFLWRADEYFIKRSRSGPSHSSLALSLIEYILVMTQKE
jgi:hypothetical protein